MSRCWSVRPPGIDKQSEKNQKPRRSGEAGAGGCGGGEVRRPARGGLTRDALSWSHHAEVAALDRDVADRVLDDAEREGCRAGGLPALVWTAAIPYILLHHLRNWARS